MSLNVVPADVLGYMGDLFSSVWPIVAIGLGLLAAPYLVRIAKAAFVRRG
ncbi:MAG: hypothetical protein QHH75_11890 [Bacillota bacterium]|nr:hypothetical protein [Bacillota bacterium]